MAVTEVSNFAQTPSRRPGTKLFGSNFTVTEMLENSVIQQKFSYFGSRPRQPVSEPVLSDIIRNLPKRL
jgi:hypothetical protein